MHFSDILQLIIHKALAVSIIHFKDRKTFENCLGAGHKAPQGEVKIEATEPDFGRWSYDASFQTGDGTRRFELKHGSQTLAPSKISDETVLWLTVFLMP